MNILLCGASGFIGRHIRQSLLDAGHQVKSAVRQPSSPLDIAVDYQRDTSPEAWMPRLEGIDVVINAVGVLRDTSRTPMAVLHSAAPRALFDAAAQCKVRKVIQISALGVHTQLNTAYARSKGEADACLQNSQLNWTILRPSLVYGDDGASAKMFRLLCKLPVVACPGGGQMLVQPVHIDDVCAAVLASLDSPAAERAVIDCVGKQSLTYKAMLQSYAKQLGVKRQVYVSIPWSVMGALAYVAQLVPASPLEPETLAMLKVGSHANAQALTTLLGCVPRGVDDFIVGHLAAHP